jgi:hypothetical protein
MQRDCHWQTKPMLSSAGLRSGGVERASAAAGKATADPKAAATIASLIVLDVICAPTARVYSGKVKKPS